LFFVIVMAFVFLIQVLNNLEVLWFGFMR
jgi:hypothetical protein